VDRIWSELRKGDYPCGGPSLADAFYLPVATRFRTYGIALSQRAQDYCERLLADEAFLAWERKVLAEPARIFQRAPIDAVYT
jgi:glutathione S-transferase